MGSNLNIYYHRMNFKSMADMSDFVNKVRLNGSLGKSVISTKMLSYIAPSLGEIDEKIILDCSYKGKVNDIRIRDLNLFFKSQTQLNANLNLTGLPNIEETFLFVDINNFATIIDDIETIRDAKTNQRLVTLPDELKSLERVTYQGNFTGFLSDFVAYGMVNSAVGKLSMDISLKPSQKTSNFNGKVSVSNLNLGKLTNNSLLGKTSLKAEVDGKLYDNKKIEAYTDATISLIQANNYDYSNIKITGDLTNKTYVGSVFLDDPNVKLNFLGKVDFSDSIPVFDFSAFVPKIDLVKLNLNKADSISQASFLLTAKFTGSNLDNSSGEIKVVNSFYKNQNGEIKTSDITLFADNNEKSKLVSIKSEFADGEIRGKYNYANIFGSLQQLMYIYIPALSADNQRPEIKPTGVENPEYNDYIIKLRLKKTKKFTDVISPSFRIAENTNVFGIYNPDFQTLTLKVKIPELFFGGNQIKDITIDGQTRDTSFFASITTPQVAIGSTLVKNIAVSLDAYNSKIQTNINWDNRQKVRNEGKLSILGTFFHTDSTEKRVAEANIFPSEIFLNDTIWNIEKTSVSVDTSQIKINNLVLYNDQQKLEVTGIVSNNPNDSILVKLDNIDLSNINFYTQSIGYNLNGQLNGTAKVTNTLNQPLFFADLLLSNLLINNQEFGELHFGSQWFAREKKLSINASNLLNNKTTLYVDGDIFPETSQLRINGNIESFPLAHIAPLLEGNVSNLSGSVQGNISVTGTTKEPSVNGTITVNEAGLTVDFLKTHYRISDKIEIKNSDILINNLTISDVNNRQAILNGAITTGYFKDIQLNLNMVPSNFQFMNTSERDNELFYGTVYATGLVLVTGSPTDVNLNVSVKTEPHTAIFLPLSSTSSVSEHSFLNFASTDPNIIIIEEELFPEEKPTTNLSLNLDLEVTSDAEAQIIIDKKLGDIIRANGSGNLKMEINPDKDVFRMFGDYIIEQGDYLFTLQGVINKKFKIGDGSSISWNGDVTDALVDIKAIYALRTTLSQLAPDQTDEKYKRRTPVECQILLTGKLMEPNIKFNIDVPAANSEPEIKALVENATNTEEKMSRQFLSLLVLNSFASEYGFNSGGAMASGQSSGFEQGLANTASELLSNQLSNWLSQWSNAFDIGLNWRPGDPNNEISSSEVELALSTQLFNDRVTLNGNVDMGATNSSSPIAGDFNIDVKIVPSGKIRLKAFTRSNDDVIFSGNQSNYTTGAGVVYREDFNTLDELWSRFQNIFNPKDDESTEKLESSWRSKPKKPNS
ncbi:MAG TPA: translocation/assembly module TamB domain-containing protein [Tenuifilaceae bacterium]|nr:translocation/assembly module TamB domain-containing protein [Tenuifilaceae bacterium]HPJ44482.1 translocation/assembly module TamB domain-containing protein [Tenuifilaceae bacterium]HPQ33020.1 translocation/assembly module TamB domain-containing protein [Tenuifilaceae bacterium]HRX67951.1 translocation/assembly module TamB domain-containing protein [Tenuifilaceae bacterium]